MSVSSYADNSESAPLGGAVPRLLIVEPDRLTQWSVAKFLARWFSIRRTGSVDGARTLLREQPVDALLLSGNLPPGAAEALDAFARAQNHALRTILMVTGEGEPHRLPAADFIEKPFELSALARLLGVPAGELAQT